MTGGLRPRTLGLLIVGSGVVIISVDSLLIRLLTQTMPFGDVIFWRGLGSAAGFLLLALPASRRGIRAMLGGVGAPGLTIAALNCGGSILFVTSVTHTTVAHALVILAATPILTAALAHVLLKERAGRRTWLVSVVVAIGLFLVFLALPSRGDLFGDLAALGGTICLALNLVVIRQARDVNIFPTFMLGGALTAALTAPFLTRLSLSPREAVLLLIVGVVVLPVGLALIMQGPRYLQAPDVSLLILLETVLGPLWVLLVIREVPDLRTLLSGAVILVALVANAVADWAQLRHQPAGLDSPDLEPVV